MKQKRNIKKRYRWALIGAALSFLGPLGEWFFLEIIFNYDQTNITLIYVYTEILTLICFTSFGYFLGKATEKIEHIAFHDSLTHVYSRSYLMQQFQELIDFKDRYKQPFSAIMIDLDHFKKVNDSHGHLVGDKTLITAAQCMVKTCRKIDIVGRYGGEEFIILCPNTIEADTIQLSERIRLNISALSARELGYAGPLTVSIGLVAVADNNNLPINKIINVLDQALYAAKDNGRNQLQIGEF